MKGRKIIEELEKRICYRQEFIKRSEEFQEAKQEIIRALDMFWNNEIKNCDSLEDALQRLSHLNKQFGNKYFSHDYCYCGA